ncbi:hypothetical protein AWZ03_008308 [Drosophila navojoa]|uniref:Uncharacterized protein n=2 Tax=Drosophila navojoa TaxID=7232 RepID=A0A484B8R4_DRONA|nr:hypothetical protein AWZ03_008308 [Drosophila navojoa]
MKIIGSCPFCQREVGSDLRPINQLNMEHINILANELKDFEPVTKSECQRSQHSTTPSQVSSTESNDSQSVSLLTEAMLNMVRREFELPADAEEQIPSDHAELILAMLSEEQNCYDKFLQNKSSKTGSKRSRK